MKHPREDDLVLYRYGEIRTAPVERHVSICRGCRDRLRTMKLDPDLLSPAPPPTRYAPRVPPATPPRPLPFWRRLLLLLAPAGTRR